MIIATFDPESPSFKKILFRGEDIFFWASQLFTEMSFFYPEEIPEHFEFLVVFDFSKYAEVESGGAARLAKLILQDNNTDCILSQAGFPFFALSRAVFKKYGFKIGQGICRILKRSGIIQMLPLKDQYPVFNLHKNREAIEHHIIQNQISCLIKKNILIEDYGSVYIDGRVEIGRGCRIGSGAVVKGSSKIGNNVHIYPHTFIENTIIADNCAVLPFCVLRDSVLEKNVQVGPYTHLRNNSLIRERAKAGNFVEMKKSILGKGSKSMHLSYLGDSTIGKNVNIGAGTITCNYDGQKKSPTVIGDNVFIGSGTELVAPVKIGRNSYVGAGSTITEDVPNDSLAIARTQQITKKGWVKKNKKKER